MSFEFDATKMDEGATLTFRWIIDWVKSTDKLPSVREVAKGRGQSIRKTRRQLQQMEDANVMRRTIRGSAPPKGYAP
jgi:DNA-binding transcriptional regulator YhcF (GntR family)